MIMRVLITLALVAAGVVRMTSGDMPEGIGFIAGSVIAGVLLGRRDHRLRQREERGEIIHDERDFYVAGRAAMFTVRLVLAVLTAARLLSLFAEGARVGPLQALLGAGTALVSGSYFLSYLLIRRRS